MSRFHRGPDGNPAPCNATRRACPVGGSHWDTLEEAARARMTSDIEPAPALRITGRADLVHGRKLAVDHANELPTVALEKLSKAFTVMVLKKGWSERKLVVVLRALVRGGHEVNYKKVAWAGARYDAEVAQRSPSRDSGEDLSSLRKDFHHLTE